MKNKFLNVKNAELNARVDVLYYELMFNPTCFKDYTSFNEWLTNIPDAELQQLAIKVDILQSFSRMERSNFEIIIIRKMMKNITCHLREKTDAVIKMVEINQETFDNRLQSIYYIFSIYFSMLDLYRRGEGIKQECICKHIGFCNKFEKQMSYSYFNINKDIEKKIKIIFQNIRDYSDQYSEVVNKYNISRRITLFQTGFNIDIIRIICSFMSMNDIPPFSWM